VKNSVPNEINKTYNGFTVDLQRRIRQHNSEIKGGAKYTTSNGKKTWHYYAVMTGFSSSVSALSCEWWIKHPTGHRRRPLKYSGPRGRIMGLHKVLEDMRFKGYDPNSKYIVWINRPYLKLLISDTIKPNVVIEAFDDFSDLIQKINLTNTPPPLDPPVDPFVKDVIDNNVIDNGENIDKDVNRCSNKDETKDETKDSKNFKDDNRDKGTKEKIKIKIFPKANALEG